MMKKCFVVPVLAGAAMVACTDSRRGGDASLALEDSLEVTVDSVAVDESMPAMADELFDDFFFNYASHANWQRERTVFPLTVVDEEQTGKMEQRQWKQESFFMNQDYYTLIFDSPRQMELSCDTTVSEATVERIDLDKARVQQFVFSRQSGRWMLHEMRWQNLPHNPNAQFLSFYKNFVSDSVFQHRSLASQIVFSGPDPDDDFSTLDGLITPDFWDAFKPEMPQHVLYNIVYGQPWQGGAQKIFLLRGIDNDMQVEMTFRQQRGRWKLVKLLM